MTLISCNLYYLANLYNGWANSNLFMEHSNQCINCCLPALLLYGLDPPPTSFFLHNVLTVAC